MVLSFPAHAGRALAIGVFLFSFKTPDYITAAHAIRERRIIRSNDDFCIVIMKDSVVLLNI
tara:strand:- start:653 stop:835 length:183 start_codon:yes stop_codon:yes gene_type:complete